MKQHKVWVISRQEFPSRSFPVAVIQGDLDDAMSVCKRRREQSPEQSSSYSASDTDWAEISIMGKIGSAQEYEMLFSGMILDFQTGQLPDGFYESVFNPCDLREPARRYEVVNGELCYRPK